MTVTIVSSSEDEGCTLSSLTRGVGGVGHHHHRQDDHSSEDEFEKEMAGEVRSALELMVSPAVSVPARPARSVGSGGPGPSSTRPVHGKHEYCVRVCTWCDITRYHMARNFQKLNDGYNFMNELHKLCIELYYKALMFHY